MTVPGGEEYPRVPPQQYTLRITRRCRDDLRVPRVGGANLQGAEDGTPWSAIVAKFRNQRSISVESTEGSLRDVGRPDIYALHGPDGARACTWFDQNEQVCWMLAFTPEHDYALFEGRANVGELLPSVDDYVELELEREADSFEERVLPGVRHLAETAIAAPGTEHKGSVGDLVRLTVTACAAASVTPGRFDLYVAVVVPPEDGAESFANWPGSQLAADLADCFNGGGYQWTGTMLTPDGPRDIDYTSELVFVVPDVPEI